MNYKGFIASSLSILIFAKFSFQVAEVVHGHLPHVHILDRRFLLRHGLDGEILLTCSPAVSASSNTVVFVICILN